MNLGKKRQKHSDVQKALKKVRADWRSFSASLDGFGSLLLSKKRIRIFLRVGIAVVVVALFGFIRAEYDNQPIVGDQPHYVLMDYSLVHDGDFNLANNFANKDSDTFGIYPPDGLAPHGQVGPGQVNTPDHQYSIHGIGLPLLTLPGFFLAGTLGMQVTMILIAVLVLYLVYYWCKAITKSVKISALASFGLFISYLFYGLTGYIFPDIVMGAIIAASLLILTKAPYSWRWQLVLGILLGFGLLVHYKMLVFAVPVLAILVFLNWKNSRKIPFATAAPLLVFTVLLFYLTYAWFGIWNPTGIIGDLGVGLQPETVFNNISAVLFDSARGLIAASPIILLLFVGLPIWFREHRNTLIMTVICIAMPLGAYVMFNDWGGGDAPTGRYAMNFLPVLMPAIALAIQRLVLIRHQIALALLFVITALITLYYLKIEKGWLGVTSPISSPILLGTPFAFDSIFPQFDLVTIPTGPYDWAKVAVGYVVVIALMVFGYQLSKRAAVKNAKTT